MSASIQPVVIAGGSGSRLWPLSRAQYPKQFLCLFGQETLLQQTVRRLGQLTSESSATNRPIIVGNEEHRFILMDQLRELGLDDFCLILEPSGRNTAPAVTLAALTAMESAQDPILVVSPADHSIGNEPAFAEALVRAVEQAHRRGIVVVGIKPQSPETGYGYIRAQGARGNLRVESFVEKPSLELAQRIFGDGEHYWNGGIFVMHASVWLEAIERFRPDILEATRAAWNARSRDGKFLRPAKDHFTAVPPDSVDYAVLERCPGSDIPLFMVPLDADWSDLGAWDAVWQMSPRNGQGNATVGDVLTEDVADSMIHADHRLVAVVGLRDVVVVETADAVLVADRRRSQLVKSIVAQLQSRDRTETALHRRVHRPWGWYDTVDAGPRFQVKRIMVKPGASLSLQLHHHRAEHWIVVSGVAEVTINGETSTLGENQSTYIPIGQSHRLKNPGELPLELIEVQSGSYLSEDDIVRLEDHYGRA